MPDTRFKLRAAAHVGLVLDEHILLLRRWNSGFSDGQYSLSAGHLEDNEEVIAAASREAREEVGIEIDPATSRVCGVMHRFRDPANVYFFILARGWSGAIENREPHKCDELRWVPINDLPDNVAPYIRRAIELTGEAVWFDSFDWDA